MVVSASPADERSGRRAGRPAVLFVDEFGWDCFFQLAAGVRRAGIRAVRVTLEPPSRIASALCFDRTIRLAGVSELACLGELLGEEEIVDVQVVESLAAATFAGLNAGPDGPGLRRLERRSVAADKVVVADVLARSGFSVPRTVPAGTAVDQVAGSLSFPLVHKRRMGSGGQGVSVVRTPDELADRLAVRRDGDDHFFEEFVEGRALQFAGVVDEQGRSLAVTYETLRRKSELGPASEIVSIDDPVLARTGLGVATALGLSGMVNINVIRDAKGRDWVHDVNPRVWGSFVAFRAAGVDFLSAYLDWLHDRPLSGRRGGAPGVRMDVFPAAVRAVDGSPGAPRTTWRYLRRATPYLRWLGPRYVAYETAHQLRQVWTVAGVRDTR